MPLTAATVTNRGVNIGKGGFSRQMSAIYGQTLTNPTTASTTKYLTTSAGPNTTTTILYRSGFSPQGNIVFDGTYANGLPDFPRNVVITVTHASAVVALSGVITGTDLYGRNLSEAWSVTAGTTSKTFTGKKSFYRIDTITVVAASDGSADTVTVGTGTVFGIDVSTPLTSLVKEYSGGSLVTNGTVVAASTASTDDPRGTYSPNSAPNGATTYIFWCISDTPEHSSD